ncbi:MAG: ATP-binding cassette domain-containing protein [Rickettsiales bacterium]|jgi:cell division transport system ATP-binding protein|nr:ATP-binding cassette domain-containing protein [Rickettsiales bacterium]
MAMETGTTISFANVAARYDGGREVLSDVSFNIGAGSFYFLGGASGAGKTTLLRLIYMLHPASRGQIKLFGRAIGGISRDEITEIRRKMSIVFQEYSLISHLSVFDNIALPLRVRGADEKYIKKIVGKTLEWVGLSQYANQRPLNLSGGQQQRVSVARAIITQPKILLADEPTGNLDDESAARLMELFLQMNKNFGTSIILATHSQKLMTTYKFPKIMVEDHHVKFMDAGEKPEKKTTEKPATINLFDEFDLLKKFDALAQGEK